MKDKVWCAYAGDYESSNLIGLFWSKESAIQCCKDAYDNERESREEDYRGKDGSEFMLWPKEPIVTEDGMCFQPEEKDGYYFAVGNGLREILP